jgi:hypothetical protein
MSEIVCYGDSVTFQSCESGDQTCLAMLRHLTGRRSPPVLWTEAAAPGRHPPGDYIWTIIPAVGCKKRRGDPVSFADRVRLQLFDYTGNYRFLAISRVDSKLVMAEKAPSSPEISTWSIAYASQLTMQADGTVQPAGELKPHLEYGTSHYVALVNAARYLSVMSGDSPGAPRHGVGTLADMPTNGVSVWWHVVRPAPQVEASSSTWRSRGQGLAAAHV